MRKRRTPGQMLVVIAVLLGGTWICILMARGDRDRRFDEQKQRLPDLEFTDRSLDEVAAELGYPWEQAPPSAERISMRIYASYSESAAGEPQRQFVQLLRARVAASDVTAERFGVLERESRRRPVAEMPPDWFPWDRAPTADGSASPFAVPVWWAPVAGTGRAVFNVQAVADGSWVGEYLHYDPTTRWLHLWEWRRTGFEPPASVYDRYPADFFAQGLAQQLVGEQHPTDAGGWLHAPDRSLDRLSIPAEFRPPGLRSVDSLLLPLAGRHRYFLAFHGLEVDAARRLIDEVPLRELPAGSPPPVARWEPVMAAVQGETRLPSWFTAGPGPRWGYTLAHPATGTVSRGRWAAYDPERRLLLVWDWERAEALPPAADLW